MTQIALVYILFGDRPSAQAAARAMVERRLAACANILASCSSVYRWEGEVTQGEEIPVLFKTMPARAEALTAALAQGHDYRLPAILTWQAIVTSDYAQWVAAETDLETSS